MSAGMIRVELKFGKGKLPVWMAPKVYERYAKEMERVLSERKAKTKTSVYRKR